VPRTPDAYFVELDVDEWGFLDGGDDLLTDDIPDWTVPFPAMDAILDLMWTPGRNRQRPNVYWHPNLEHWVCDERAFEVLTKTVAHDIHVIARASVDGRPAWAVQVVTRMVGIVDESTSLFERGMMRWPSFRLGAAERMADRLFAVPELYLDVFMGSAVRAALDTADLMGLTYVAVDWTSDLEWAARAPDARGAWDLAAELAAMNRWPSGRPAGLIHLARLMRLDRSIRDLGLVQTLANLGHEIDSAIAAADYLQMTDLAAVLRALPHWTKATLGELAAGYDAATAGDALHIAFARAYPDRPNAFSASPVPAVGAD
jgi:hypothetical protein